MKQPFSKHINGTAVFDLLVEVLPGFILKTTIKGEIAGSIMDCVFMFEVASTTGTLRYGVNRTKIKVEPGSTIGLERVKDYTLKDVETDMCVYPTKEEYNLYISRKKGI